MKPAPYDLEFYRGDTLSFVLVPTDKTGAPIDLTSATVRFIVATGRGDTPPAVPGYPSTIECTASKISGNTKVQCIITKANGLSMKAGTPYVYDVFIDIGGSVTTYLTGNVNVTERVVAP